MTAEMKAGQEEMKALEEEMEARLEKKMKSEQERMLERGDFVVFLMQRERRRLVILHLTSTLILQIVIIGVDTFVPSEHQHIKTSLEDISVKVRDGAAFCPESTIKGLIRA
ncbi:hypothetical protein AVEN_194722-1 [Araneus ventricosus]|uniref:Uncharacterized protein n=1 Tax=Araneus ventricosus TaxID=182803 RepID=A0A4Y2NDZ1_ARAVE|nr:hypothetical protein AVEN_194722-1 [Araneus ventricosus]